MYCLRTAWNQAQDEVAPWWAECPQEVYVSGLDRLSTGVKNGKDSQRAERTPARPDAVIAVDLGITTLAVFWRRASALGRTHGIWPRPRTLRGRPPAVRRWAGVWCAAPGSNRPTGGSAPTTPAIGFTTAVGCAAFRA
jgi:hypothetical protein